MKKLVLGACLLSASVAGFAGEGDIIDRNGAYAHLGAYKLDLDSARQASQDIDLGFGLGWAFNKNWAVEGVYTKINNLEHYPSGATPDLESYMLDLVYNDTSWLGNVKTHPFVKLGYGKHNAIYNPWGSPGVENDEFYKVGLGLEHYLTDNFFMRLGLDILDGSDDYQDDKFTYINFGYFFGDVVRDSAPATVKAPEVAPKDSDGDGVIDANDRCPGTPAGTKVDAYGCALDSDGDGVLDNQDACPNTPAGAKVDEKGCQIQEKVVIDMRLNFDTNKYAIKPEMVSEIAKVAEFLRQFSNVDAEIQGHTDSVGSAKYNQGLSERRAKSVVDYLVANFGIEASRLSGVGYGEARPIADNATAEGRALNRRAEANLESK